ncbi:MAG: hypothetical protein U0V64_09515 [Cyclobacteriaceae bacterium]
MIHDPELHEINRKLSWMIAINVIAYSSLILAFVGVVYYDQLWLVWILLAIGALYIPLSIWIFMRMRKHIAMKYTTRVE